MKVQSIELPAGWTALRESDDVILYWPTEDPFSGPRFGFPTTGDVMGALKGALHGQRTRVAPFIFTPEDKRGRGCRVGVVGENAAVLHFFIPMEVLRELVRHIEGPSPLEGPHH